ncbi:hypothetical protein ACJRO7_028929 [Eucalyptus globulus]|uniref:Uncharacterized protein n=1 Tax=Eucalyptus globulus TaxID=34317 RepID=A0ABD3JWS5_EUCGL
MAGHWTSATLSCLISFFLNLASYIPWLASSCNNQISNCTTASASHGCASTTRCPVVDDSISVVVDIPLPTDDGAIRPSNVHGTRSTTTVGTSQTRTFDSSQSGPVHPILKLFQRQELGKEVLGFTVPMTTGLLFNQNQGLTYLQASAVILALSIGFKTTWNGMLLREMCPCVASALECFGVASVLVAFFGLVSSFLLPSLVWACWLCCGLSCLPFLLFLVPPTAANEESSAERLDEGIV